MSREFRWNTRVDKQWQYMPAVTPRSHRFRFLLWKLRNKDQISPELKEQLSEPTLRCLNCGCKYDFRKVTKCPMCDSDKSGILENEDPWTDPATYLAVGTLVILFTALRPVLMHLLHG